MEILAIVLGSFVLACVCSIVLITVNERRKRRVIINRFRRGCVAYHFLDEGCSVWGDSVIGIDVKGETLCFQKDEKTPVAIFPIRMLTGCRVEVQRSGEGNVVLDRVELCLVSSKLKGDGRIVFFDARDRFYISNELILAQEWQGRLNALIKAK
ncbi:MAG: hypothetical protein ACWA6U_16890 [Breznakibacter sp.]